MVGTVRKNCKLTPDYIILVLDCFTAKQFVQLDIRFFDMYKFKVFQVEDLTKMRKRYPQSDVLYYVAPCMDSVSRIANDFKDVDQFDFDQYGMVHLAFCGPVPHNVMSVLYQSRKLCDKIVSFFEVNMDFSLVVDNAFLTKIIPFDTQISEQRQVIEKDYKYVETPNDKEIKANKYALASGKAISKHAAERVCD